MNDRARQTLVTAAQAFQAGDFNAALAGADAALAAAPGDAEGLHLRALALARLGRLEDAICDYEAAARVHPQRHAVLSNLGNALAAAGRADAALAAYRAAVAAAPAFADGWYNLAAALKAGGDLGGAITALKRAVGLAPRNARALNNLGTALNEAGRAGEAIAVFGEAIAADPAFAPSYVNRGKLLRTQNDFAGARADHERATALAPGLVEAHYQLACTLRIAGDVDAAAAAFRRAIALFPQSIAAHGDLANMLWEAGRADEYRRTLEDVLARHPTADLLDLKARLSLPAGDLGAAEIAGKELVERHPRDPRGYLRVARVRRHQRRREDAIAFARRGFEADPENFEARHEFAEALLAGARPGEAARLLGGDAPRPHLQKHLALLALAMRASGDERYKRLYDYDRFAKKIRIETPKGYRDLDEFNAALYEALLPLHRANRQRPIDQTLYGGTQSFGRLWDESSPVIAELKAALLETSRRYVESLPDDPEHPFLKSKTTDLACAGSWSVILAAGGGHVDHYHPQGWISASYYVRIPPEVAASEKAGHLRLGASGVDGLALAAERWIRPEEGVVIIFPSYMWHGVEPFQSTAPRVTAPFDLAPRLTAD